MQSFTTTRAGARTPNRLPASQPLLRGALLLIIGLPLLFGSNDGLRAIGDTVRGVGPPTDFVQDIVGARALGQHTDAYPVLADGAAELGVAWPIVEHRSTHPPTAFLFAL